MRNLSVACAICVLALAASTFAQSPPAPDAQRRGSAQQPRTAPPAAKDDAQPPTAAAPARQRREGQPINIKIEFTLMDQRGKEAPIKRIVSVVVADGRSGMIRSQSEVFQVGGVPLNIDALPELLADDKIRLAFNVQYDWPAPLDGAPDKTPPRGSVIKTALHDSVSLILESGKAMIAAQSADPIGDRQVSVEVKATILR